MDGSRGPENGDDSSVSSAVGDAANILLLEPASTEDENCFDLLTPISPPEEDVLVISLEWSLDEWYDAWQRQFGEELPANVGFITTDERRSTTDPSPDVSPLQKSLDIKTISGPANLTAIGVEVTDFISAWEADTNQIVICVRSLTPMLMHTDLQATYRFLHTMTGVVQTSDATAHYHLNPGTCDDQTLNTLKTLFDALVEVDQDGTWTVTKE